MCILNEEKRQEIAAAAAIYINEIIKINNLLEQKQDPILKKKLLLIRAITTIAYGKKIGLFDENLEDDLLNKIAEEHLKYCKNIDNSALFEDIAILEESTKEKFFADPIGEKLRLAYELHGVI